MRLSLDELRDEITRLYGESAADGESTRQRGALQAELARRENAKHEGYPEPGDEGEDEEEEEEKIPDPNNLNTPEYAQQLRETHEALTVLLADRTAHLAHLRRAEASLRRLLEKLGAN